MTPAVFHLAGERLLLDPAGAVWWPDQGLLAVADLHLETGSAWAARGRLLPPWDTRVTLDRLALLLRRFRPRVLVALGDSFHDRAGATRMVPADAARLRQMTDGIRMVWVLGNHDPVPPAGLDGEATEAFALGPLRFRHIAASGEPGEISGHFHPRASIPTRAGEVGRPCFVADARRVVLPAFGAYTGGLDVRSPVLAALFPRGGRAFLLGRDRLFSFALAELAAAPT